MITSLKGVDHFHSLLLIVLTVPLLMKVIDLGFPHMIVCRRYGEPCVEYILDFLFICASFLGAF